LNGTEAVAVWANPYEDPARRTPDTVNDLDYEADSPVGMPVDDYGDEHFEDQLALGPRRIHYIPNAPQPIYEDYVPNALQPMYENVTSDDDDNDRRSPIPVVTVNNVVSQHSQLTEGMCLDC
jgi:hypothetical protein